MSAKASFFSLLILGVALALGGCEPLSSVTYTTDPQQFEFNLDALSLPPEFSAAMSGVLPSVPCTAATGCPSSGDFQLTCSNGVCDPEPYSTSIRVGVPITIDAQVLEIASVINEVADYVVEEVSYTVDANSLTLDVPETEIYWGPASAVDIDPAQGVMRLGTMPSVAAGVTPTGTMVLDNVGIQGFGEHLLNTSQEVTFFALPLVDLDPGDPFPAGALQVSVRVRIRIMGSLF